MVFPELTQTRVGCSDEDSPLFLRFPMASTARGSFAKENREKTACVETEMPKSQVSPDIRRVMLKLVDLDFGISRVNEGLRNANAKIIDVETKLLSVDAATHCVKQSQLQMEARKTESKGIGTICWTREACTYILQGNLTNTSILKIVEDLSGKVDKLTARLQNIDALLVEI